MTPLWGFHHSVPRVTLSIFKTFIPCEILWTFSTAHFPPPDFRHLCRCRKKRNGRPDLHTAKGRGWTCTASSGRFLPTVAICVEISWAKCIYIKITVTLPWARATSLRVVPAGKQSHRWSSSKERINLSARAGTLSPLLHAPIRSLLQFIMHHSSPQSLFEKVTALAQTHTWCLMKIRRSRVCIVNWEGPQNQPVHVDRSQNPWLDNKQTKFSSQGTMRIRSRYHKGQSGHQSDKETRSQTVSPSLEIMPGNKKSQNVIWQLLWSPWARSVALAPVTAHIFIRCGWNPTAYRSFILISDMASSGCFWLVI